MRKLYRSLRNQHFCQSDTRGVPVQLRQVLGSAPSGGATLRRHLRFDTEALGETSDENHYVISFSFDSTVARHTRADASRFASSSAEGPSTL